MKQKLSKWFDTIKGDTANFTLEHRIFNISTFTSCLLTFVSIFINYFIEIHYSNFILIVVAFIFYAYLFYQSRFKHSFEKYIITFVVWTQAVLSGFWFINAGSEGGILPVFIASLVLYITFSPSKYHIFIIVVSIANQVALYIVEYYYPNLFIPYPNRESRYIDVPITYSFVIVSLGLAVHLFKKSFDDERHNNFLNSKILAELSIETRVKRIMENSLDAVITIDDQGNIIEWNNSATKIFGYTPKEALTSKLSNLIIPIELRPSFENAVNFFNERTNFIRFETGGVRKNGKNFPIELSMSQLIYKDKNMINFFIRDITERKENEEKILQKNILLQQLNEEMDNFIYRASHDLRAPLTNMLGIINLFEVIQDENDKKELLEGINVNINKMMRMTEDLSNYSKNYKFEPEHSPINVREIVDKIISEKLHAMENFDNVKIEINETPNDQFISDPMRIQVILYNLIENAIIFCDHPDKSLIIQVHVHKEKESIKLHISDNGDGIKPETLPKIFDMFYRGSIKSRGSGLGLYIVKRIVNKLKGNIEVRSRRSEGTEFVIELPNQEFWE